MKKRKFLLETDRFDDDLLWKQLLLYSSPSAVGGAVRFWIWNFAVLTKNAALANFIRSFFEIKQETQIYSKNHKKKKQSDLIRIQKIQILKVKNSQ